MRLLHSRNSWTFSYGFNMMVDFCTWVLEVDGLHVPPFDQHPEGDGSLRAAGLDAEAWQSWIIRVVNLQYEHQQRTRKDPLNPQFDLRSVLIPEVYDPPSTWTGNAAVGSRLAELGKQYGPISNERKKAEARLTRKWHQVETEQRINLWRELSPYHSRIPTLVVHMVQYEQPINYLIPPVSVIMTYAGGQPGAAEFRERLLDAAAELTASSSSRRRKQSTYTLAPYTMLNQPTPMYKTYPRRPVQPAAARSRASIVAGNEAKQIILDTLYNDDYIYGEVNLATVQFPREKAIPGWQMYYVTFEEVDGHKHNYIVFLRQREDGSWMFNGSSTGGDFREIAAQVFAPVHDHPLIAIAGRKGGHADNQYEFVANGEVIDNGFDVTRVRLVNDAGQVFEDTVQDGLVLFATIQDREVQWPMQAELYNRAGKLVWRETVLDNSPPPWLKLRRT
jgi:hypothetical protein